MTYRKIAVCQYDLSKPSPNKIMTTTMKRIFLLLCLPLLSCFGAVAQSNIIIRTTNGGVDTYPFSRDTQIRLRDGKVELSTPQVTRVYSPSDILKMGFDVLIEGITLNYEVYTLNVGKSINLEAAISPDDATNKALSWSSSNEDAVMVNQSGRAVYVDNGEAIVTASATDGSGVTASCVFTCVDGIVTIIFNDKNLKVYQADGKKLPALSPGLNIVRMNDRTVKKILVR